MSKITVMIVDDEPDIRESLSQLLEIEDIKTVTYETAADAISAIGRDAPYVIISDIRMPRMDGMEFLNRIMAVDRSIPVIMITGHGEVQLAVEAMRLGAYDFIEKPFEPERLLSQITHAINARSLLLDNRILRSALMDPARLEHLIVGQSLATKNIRSTILDFAQIDDHLLIEGENGTGRSLAARSIHSASEFARFPMSVFNCAAFDDDEFDTKFFKGDGSAPAVFLSRQRMTLVLDEIDALSPRLQTKLAQVLEDNDEDRERIRVIAMRTAPSEREIVPELTARLGGMRLILPAMRDRREDILPIFNKYYEHFRTEYGADSPDISADQAAVLMAAHWPGNVRQVINFAEKLALAGDDDKHKKIFDEEFSDIDGARLGSAPSPLKSQVEAFEEMLIRNSLKRHSGSIAAVLDELALPRRTLNEKMARYGLSRSDFV